MGEGPPSVRGQGKGAGGRSTLDTGPCCEQPCVSPTVPIHRPWLTVGLPARAESPRSQSVISEGPRRDGPHWGGFVVVRGPNDQE